MADHSAITLRCMDRKRRSNPYIKLVSADLYRACQQRAGELLGPSRPRTPDERAELALDTAHLLLALARYVDTSEHVPETPKQAMKDPRVGIAEAFTAYHEQLAKTARYQTLIRAVEMATGGTAISVDIYKLAMSSDDGLREALAQLDEQYRERRAKNR